MPRTQTPTRSPDFKEGANLKREVFPKSFFFLRVVFLPICVGEGVHFPDLARKEVDLNPTRKRKDTLTSLFFVPET